MNRKRRERYLTQRISVQTSDEIGESIFSTLRDYTKHEDYLISDRTSWFIQLNSILFGALAISISIVATSGVEGSTIPLAFTLISASTLLCILSLIGVFSSLTTFISVKAAHNSIFRLREVWRVYFYSQVNIVQSKMPPVSLSNGKPLREQSAETAWLEKNFMHAGSLSSIFLPLLIGTTWTILFSLAFSVQAGVRNMECRVPIWELACQSLVDEVQRQSHRTTITAPAF